MYLITRYESTEAHFNVQCVSIAVSSPGEGERCNRMSRMLCCESGNNACSVPLSKSESPVREGDRAETAGEGRMRREGE